MVEVLDKGYYTSGVFRGQTKNPKHPFCLLHLQRICGTCAHYTGQLRPPRIGHDKAAIDTATCGRTALDAHRQAKGCSDWARKAAENV
jgi:hypothetical protein